MEIIMTVIILALSAFASYYVSNRFFSKQKEKQLNINYRPFLRQFEMIKETVEWIEKGAREPGSISLHNVERRWKQINEENIPVAVFKPFLSLKQGVDDMLIDLKEMQQSSGNEASKKEHAKQFQKRLDTILKSYKKIEDFAKRVAS